MAMTDGEEFDVGVLNTAISDAIEAAFGDGNRLITESITVASILTFGEDGEQYAIACIPSDKNLADHRVLGLLEYASTCYRAEIGGGDVHWIGEDDDDYEE